MEKFSPQKYTAQKNCRDLLWIYQKATSLKICLLYLVLVYVNSSGKTI